MTPPIEKNVADEDQHQQKEIVLLDGGFATQLSCHVEEQIDGDVLWSARFLQTNPEAVIETHLDFLRGLWLSLLSMWRDNISFPAGADVIMTNTYQASIEGFVKYLNLTEEESYNLIKKAVDYTRIARKRFFKEYPHLSKNSQA